MPTFRDTRPVAWLKFTGGKWHLKVPSSSYQAARSYRPIPDWPGMQAAKQTLNDAGYRVEVE